MAVVSFKFAIRPTVEQKKELKRQLSLCASLQDLLVKHSFEQIQCGFPLPSHYTLCNMLPQLKKDHVALSTINSQVLQSIAKRVAQATRKVATKNAKYGNIQDILPQRLLTYPQWGKGCRFTSNDSIYFDKLGEFKLSHSTERVTGNIKTVSVMVTETGRWHVVLHSEVESKPTKKARRVIGMDFGVKNFITLSDGVIFPFPPMLVKDRKEAVKTQKELKKCRGKQENILRRRLATIQQRYKNRLTQFLHVTVTQLVQRYDCFYVEDINKDNMRSFARAMPWRRFISQLKTRCEMEGKGFVLVSPVNTTRRCSQCGNIKTAAVPLRERVYECFECGFVLNRDINAAINMIQMAR